MANNTKPAILCPSCGKLISADAEKCIHCGMKNPGKFGLHSVLKKLFRNNIGFIQVVTYFCIGLYVLGLLIDPAELFRPKGLLSFLSPSIKSLYFLGMTGRIAIDSGRWWTLITAIYLHGGILHILFNLLWIRQLGPMVEGLFGTARFIIIFTISGVLGFMLSTIAKTPLTVGASGSIFGLLGALIYYGRARGGVFGQVLYPQILTWAVVLFLFGFIFPRIDNFAHLGGFVGGYLCGRVFGYQEFKSETAGYRTFAVIVITVTILSFTLNFLTLLILV